MFINKISNFEKIIEVLKQKEVKIFISTFLIYTLSLSLRRYVHGEDEVGYFLLTYSIVEHHTFILDATLEELQVTTTWIVYREGHYYSVYPPGYPFFCIPFYILGKAIWFLLAQLGVFSNPAWWFKRFAYWSMMIVSIMSTSLTTVLIYRLCKSLNFAERVSTIVSLTYAYGSIVWVYAKTAFSHSLSALFIMLAIYFAITAIDNRNKKKLILSGLAIGYAIVIRYSNILLVFPLSFYVYMKTRSLRNTALFLISVFCDSVILLFYNFFAFEHPFVTGYHLGFENLSNQFSTPIYVGLYGLLFGISRGLFTYSPVLLFSLIGMYLWKNQREEYFLFFSSFFSILLFYSMWDDWFGGPYWGARFLIPVLSCFVMFICPVIKKYGSKNWFWIIYYILLFYSGFSSLVGVSWRLIVPFLGYYPVFRQLNSLITPDTLLSYIFSTLNFPLWWATILLSILVIFFYIVVAYPVIFSYLSRKLKTRQY